MTDANLKLSKSVIIGIEREFSRNDTTHARTYLKDTLEFHLQEVAELERRKLLLRNIVDYDPDIPIYVGVLCALTNDQEGWSELIAIHGSNLPPSTGHFSFGYLNNAELSLERKLEWLHLLEWSAKNGHKPSKLALLHHSKKSKIRKVIEALRIQLS